MILESEDDLTMIRYKLDLLNWLGVELVVLLQLPGYQLPLLPPKRHCVCQQDWQEKSTQKKHPKIVQTYFFISEYAVILFQLKIKTSTPPNFRKKKNYTDVTDVTILNYNS